MGSGSENSDPALGARYAELIGRLEEGELDPDEVLAGERGDEEELRRAVDGWRELDGLLARCGLDGSGHEPLDPRTAELLRRLGARKGSERYRGGAEVGRGGMARVVRAYDEDLGRDVAMKLLLDARESTSATRASAELLQRFLDEARITGALEHPGILPVHELGVDAEGRAYFTMPLVDGRDLASILREARGTPPAAAEGGDGWTRTRILGAVLKVCQAMAYAHSKGVIHRDLKPSNVMVGRFGEVYVMDWGLARPAGERGDPRASIGRAAHQGGDSPLVTLPGQVVGTPAYMSPEQAAGRSEDVGPPSDVYAVGAVLYEVLTGAAPHVWPGETAGRAEVLQRLVAGPPPPIDRRKVPAELAAICEKAMEREPANRYPSMLALAKDLRAYLEGRVVRAHRTGPWIEIEKWIARNRGTAAAGALAALAIALGLAGMVRERLQSRERLVRLADVQVLASLEQEADELWPVLADAEPGLVDWLRRADGLAARMDGHRRELDRVRERALPYTARIRERDRSTHPAHAVLDGLRVQIEMLEGGHADVVERAHVESHPSGSTEERIASLERRVEELSALIDSRRTWRFEDPADRAQHQALTQLVSDWAGFDHPDPRVGARASVRSRLERAQAIASRRLGEHEGLWRRTRRAVLADERYGGLDLAPQAGLVPLGPDPRSGLQEFAHLPTGAVPERGPDGMLAPEPGSGVVLTLLPAGRATLGSIPVPEEQVGAVPYGDPRSRESERPLSQADLAPFFLSKYELTQAQWRRMTGENPSHHYPGFRVGVGEVTETNPVERLSWEDCDHWLPRYDLVLPTEAQWEYAARAATTTPFWTGTDPEELVGVENVDDRLYRTSSAERVGKPHQDGWSSHAPVGTFAPNPWGFHDVLGNVHELCRDSFWVDGRWPRRPGDGLRRPPEEQGNRAWRGGSYYGAPTTARVSNRETIKLDFRTPQSGVRPARPVR